MYKVRMEKFIRIGYSDKIRMKKNNNKKKKRKGDGEK